MEITHLDARNQGLQNIHYMIFPIQSEQITARSKLIQHIALIKYVMTYDCPAW
jgi:hypothetical protein